MTAWPLIQPDSLEDRLFGWRRVKDMTGLSRSTAWRLQQLGKFPAPVRISTKRVAWRESDLLAWKAAKLDDKTTVPKRTFRPPRSSKLPGMSRRVPAAPAPVAEPPPIVAEQARLDLQPVAPTAVLRKARRRASTVSPGQIDFGF